MLLVKYLLFTSAEHRSSIIFCMLSRLCSKERICYCFRSPVTSRLLMPSTRAPSSRTSATSASWWKESGWVSTEGTCVRMSLHCADVRVLMSRSTPPVTSGIAPTRSALLTSAWRSSWSWTRSRTTTTTAWPTFSPTETSTTACWAWPGSEPPQVSSLPRYLSNHVWVFPPAGVISGPIIPWDSTFKCWFIRIVSASNTNSDNLQMWWFPVARLRCSRCVEVAALVSEPRFFVWSSDGKHCRVEVFNLLETATHTPTHTLLDWLACPVCFQ